MEVTILARNLTVSDRFKEYVQERTHKVEQLAHRVQELKIKVTRHDHSKNSGTEDQVELTVLEPGHVVRAEAQAADKFAAFDIALDRLSERLRRAADKRRIHRGQHRQISTSEITAHDFAELDVRPASAEALLHAPAGSAPSSAAASGASSAQPGEISEAVDLGESPVVIRRKEFAAEAMTVEDALDRMELVGHDFYLFIDTETERPTVVYKRKGWNYGVISLG